MKYNAGNAMTKGIRRADIAEVRVMVITRTQFRYGLRDLFYVPTVEFLDSDGDIIWRGEFITLSAANRFAAKLR